MRQLVQSYFRYDLSIINEKGDSVELEDIYGLKKSENGLPFIRLIKEYIFVKKYETNYNQSTQFPTP